MKKLLLVVLLALSLQGSSIMCEDAFERVQKYNKALSFAAESNDMFQIKVNIKMVILYAEKALVECGDDWKFKDATMNLRKGMINLSKKLERP